MHQRRPVRLWPCLIVVASLVLAACSSPAPTHHADSKARVSSVRGVTDSPLPGYMLIADRGNGRLLIVTPAKKIVWSVTLDRSAAWTAAPLAADDAFLSPDGRTISINAEDMQVLAHVDLRTRKITWSYGHDGFFGSAPGYLHTPDDAYPLPNGDTLVADIFNQRIIEISPAGQIVRQVGTTGLRLHDPPRAFAAPNGDTPLPDGGILVTEIGGSWVDRINAAGRLVWSLQLPGIHYPSDAQLLPDGSILVVDYHSPGTILRIRPDGHVVWRYLVRAGPGRLDHPSLAIALPNGLVALNDDDNNRVVIINPATNAIVWQYGHTGVPGMRPGFLNGPDGIDFLPPGTKL